MRNHRRRQPHECTMYRLAVPVQLEALHASAPWYVPTTHHCCMKGDAQVSGARDTREHVRLITGMLHAGAPCPPAFLAEVQALLTP